MFKIVTFRTSCCRTILWFTADFEEEGVVGDYFIAVSSCWGLDVKVTLKVGGAGKEG